jgi:hypothetical protein
MYTAVTKAYIITEKKDKNLSELITKLQQQTLFGKKN